MENNDLGPTIVTLKAEVDFLGAELTAAKAEIARLRAGGCARDQGTTQYCAEAAKLADENEKLRAALGEIIKLDDEWVPEAQDDYTYTGYQVCADIARAALEGKHD